MASAIGASIDREDGDSGIKGAILGYVAINAAKSAVRLGALAALSYGAYALFRRAVGGRP